MILCTPITLMQTSRTSADRKKTIQETHLHPLKASCTQKCRYDILQNDNPQNVPGDRHPLHSHVI